MLRSRSTLGVQVTGGIPSRQASERHRKHWGRGRVSFGFHGAWIPQAPAAGRRTIQPHDHWGRATSGPTRPGDSAKPIAALPCISFRR